eukprot:jgi/Tetstr1/421001/TSEL_001084.t1
MKALKPDQESYSVYCSRAYNRLPKGNTWVLTAHRWENWGAAGLVPADFYTRQTAEQRKDPAFMQTGFADAENQYMFLEIIADRPARPRATNASVSTFHAAVWTDDASWEDILLPRGAREPALVPRGPPLRYYLTTGNADDTLRRF